VGYGPMCPSGPSFEAKEVIRLSGDGVGDFDFSHFGGSEHWGPGPNFWCLDCLLCGSCERLRRSAAEQRDELAASHSITSSARARNVAGTSRPIDLAVVRLTTSSYFVGNCTGSSEGLAPFRMRSTYEGAC
jgi:hypothetical protein